jgi:hypothetical protein
VQQIAQGGELVVGEAGAQALVEADNRAAKRMEHLAPAVSELDVVDPPVQRITRSAHEPGGLHAVEVMGERRPFDADIGGDRPLRRVGATAQRQENEPHRQGPAALGQGGIEGPAHGLGGSGEQQPDRLLGRSRAHGAMIELESFDIKELGARVIRARVLPTGSPPCRSMG